MSTDDLDTGDTTEIEAYMGVCRSEVDGTLERLLPTQTEAPPAAIEAMRYQPVRRRQATAPHPDPGGCEHRGSNRVGASPDPRSPRRVCDRDDSYLLAHSRRPPDDG